MKTYLVGGAVRDALLKYPFHERDWVVVGATPQQMIDLGYQQVGSDFPVFLHPQSKEEYALARTERKSGPGYTGFECYASPEVTLEQDLQRRDLTINAIAQQDDGTLIDPYGGQKDIQDKVLRHVSPAFEEDPLRVLRIARFMARYAHLGFTVAAETQQLMRNISRGDELLSLPAERIWKELEKALNEKSPQSFFSVLKQCDALAKLMPELNVIDLSPLDKAASQTTDPVLRFALLLGNTTEENCRSFCQRVKVPNVYRDLAIICSQQLPSCTSNLDSAEALLLILEQCDAFRRADRFESFLECLEIHTASKIAAEKLRAALQSINNINVKSLLEQGLKGPEIATALREQRLQKIAAGQKYDR